MNAADHATALESLLTGFGFRRHPLSRNAVGHLQLAGRIGDAPVDILLDTGAASTIVDLGHCRALGVPVRDIGQVGGGAGGVHLPIYALDGITLTLDGAPLRSDGIFAIDMSHVNQGLAMKGASKVHAVLGADVLLLHQAVIDYATRSLYLKH